MRKQLKSIVVAGMIATLSFATLAGCGSKSTAKNDETTISDTVKQTQKQTEKTTEATSAAESTAAEEVTTESESTEAEVSSDAIVAAEPANEVVVANEPSDEPAYAPADIPAEEPVDDTPASAEPAVHEHNWTPVYCYIEWIASQTTIEDQYVPGGTVTITRFEQAGQLTDHYECDCGATKDGKNKSDIAKILSTKNVPEGGILYYTDLREYEESLCKTLPSYSGYGQWHPSVGQW